MSVSDLAKLTAALGFAERDDPFGLFADWLADAEKSEPNDANAMALATVDGEGLPNVRMVLLKGIDAAEHAARGFVFYTNFESAKGRELLASGKAGLLFHWKSLRRQVRIRGPVTPVTDAEADAYFATRSRESRIGAWASDQSRPVESREALDASYEARAKEFEGRDIPRPPHWHGYRLVPLEVEFWVGGRHRLHDRIAFHRPSPAASWTKTRLYP